MGSEQWSEEAETVPLTADHWNAIDPMNPQPSPRRPETSGRYRRRMTAFDWLVIAGGLVNLAVVSVIFGYAVFM